ncbi:hypothetical protein Tco_1197477, partial [Tanacetum coccineum]
MANAEQAPAMASPVRTDEQIVPRNRWVPIGKSNCYLNEEKSQRRSGYQQKDRKPSQNDKTEHGIEKTVQNQGQSPKKSKSKSKLKNTIGCNLNPS